MKTMPNRRGFSLLELTLVLVIIGLMAAGAAVALSGQGTRAKMRITWSSMNTIKAAIDQYHLNTSQYPPSLAALQAPPMPYLEPEKPLKDAWKQDFLYSPSPTSAGRPYDLISKGPDGKYPTADDLDIWRQPAE
jgi:general secretion pathway protein G